MAHFRSSLREVVADVERRPLASPFAERLSAPASARPGWSPRLCFLVCATHRSGSNLLCEAFTGTGLAGQPYAYFREPLLRTLAGRWNVGDFSAYLQALFDRTSTPNEVFGAKVMADDLPGLLAALPDLPGLERLEGHALLAAAFPNLRYVWLRRADKLRQAISWERAAQTGLWTDYGEQLPIVPARPRFDKRAIQARLDELERSEAVWQQFFEHAGVQPVQVGYEELAADYRPPPGACSSSSASSCRPSSGSRHGGCAPWPTRSAQRWVERFDGGRCEQLKASLLDHAATPSPSAWSCATKRRSSGDGDRQRDPGRGRGRRRRHRARATEPERLHSRRRPSDRGGLTRRPRRRPRAAARPCERRLDPCARRRRGAGSGQPGTGIGELSASAAYDGFALLIRNYLYEWPSVKWRPATRRPDTRRSVTGYLPTSPIRLFRRRREYVYSGPLHQSVLPAILASGGRVGTADVTMSSPRLPALGAGQVGPLRRARAPARGPARRSARPDRTGHRLSAPKPLSSGLDAFLRAFALEHGGAGAFLLGSMLHELDDPARAIPLLHEASRRNHDDESPYYDRADAREELALALEALDRREDAERAYRERSAFSRRQSGGSRRPCRHHPDRASRQA